MTEQTSAHSADLVPTAWRAFADLTVAIVDPAADPTAEASVASAPSDRLPTPRRTTR